MKPSKPRYSPIKLDRLAARCEAHRNDNRGRTRKKGNTSKLKPPQQLNWMPNTARATAEPPKDTNQSNKVQQDASSGHASTTEQAKSSQQAQTSIETKKTTDNPEQRKATPKDRKTGRGQEANIKHQPATGHTLKYLSTNGKKDGLITPDGLSAASGVNKLRHRTDMKELIFQMLAAGYEPAAIARQVFTSSGIRVSRQSVAGMKHKNLDLIEKYRGSIVKDITLCAPVASKARRIVERQELIDSLKRQIWKVTGKPGKRVITGLHEQINRILDSVKAELEPYEVNLTHGLQEQTAAQFKDLDDKSVINQAMQQLKDAGMEIAVVVPPKEQT